MANQLKMAKIDAILHLHEQKWSKRRIARELGVHRDTVARVIRTAEKISKQAGALTAQNRPPQPEAPLGSAAASPLPPSSLSASVCEPFRAVILAKLDQGLC